MNQQTGRRMWYPVPNTFMYVTVDLQEVQIKNDAACHVVNGLSAAMPTLADVWSYLHSALNDSLALAAEVERLATELQRARLDRANLLAAARATLSASSDGEADPLYYLRDELDALTTPPDDTGRPA
jgi:hypothetical protein